MAGNPRAVVLDILIEVLEHGGFSHQTIYRLLNEEGFTSKERAFAVRLARGTIENALLLDDCIDQVSKTPVRKMKPLVRNVLREAVYQIRFMDNVPDSAAVNEAVKLMRKRGLSQLSGFVNGVLRGYLRARDAGKEPQPRTDEARYSTPQWILDLWQESYPSEMKSILEGLNQKPDLTVAVNTRKISSVDLISRLREEGVEAEFLETEQVEAELLETEQFCTVTEQPGSKSEGPGGRQKSSSLDKIRLNSSVDLERLPEFKEGLFYVQDLSSMLPAEAVMGNLSQADTQGSYKQADTQGSYKQTDGQDSSKQTDSQGYSKQTDDQGSGKQADTQAPLTVIDLCSAPGGKSINMSLLLGENANIISRDQSEEKIGKIRENAARLGISNIHPQVWDGTKTDPDMIGKADVILADLPCSGLGVFNRKPDIKYRVNEKDLQELQNLQREILTASLPYLKDGGLLVYSTCTVNPGENQENRDWILREAPHLSLIEDRQVFASARQDGFYVAVFRQTR